MMAAISGGAVTVVLMTASAATSVASATFRVLITVVTALRNVVVRRIIIVRTAFFVVRFHLRFTGVLRGCRLLYVRVVLRALLLTGFSVVVASAATSFAVFRSGHVASGVGLVVTVLPVVASDCVIITVTISAMTCMSALTTVASARAMTTSFCAAMTSSVASGTCLDAEHAVEARAIP